MHAIPKLLIAALVTATFAMISFATVSSLNYKARPTITRAFDLIEDFPRQVPVNTPAIFKVKASRSAKRILDAGIVVRVFSLAPHNATPEPLTRIADCDVYLSVSYRLLPVSDTESRLEGISTLDKGWLNLSNSLRSVEAGHYFFVFEQADSVVSSSEHFRLRSADAASYFRTGFKVKIDPAGTELSAEPLRRKYLEREAHLGKLKAEADSRPDSILCFSFQPVTILAKSNTRFTQGTLHACAKQVPSVAA